MPNFPDDLEDNQYVSDETIGIPNRMPAGIDFNAILQMAKKPFIKDKKVAALPPKKVIVPAPQKKTSPLVDAAKEAVEGQEILKRSSPGSDIHSSVARKASEGTKETSALLMTPEEFSTISEMFRSTPEWQNQVKGIEDMDKLLALDMQRKAGKTSLDLSPLGAYIDQQNARAGERTNYAGVLKGAPQEEMPMDQAAEIQRRRADLTKELLTGTRAAKVGQIVSQDGTVIDTKAETTPHKTAVSNIASQRLHDTNRNKFFSWADSTLKDSDKQKAGLDSLAEILRVNNPASIGRIPLKRAISDMGGNGRVAVQEVMLEVGSQAFKDRWAASLSKWVNGTLDARNKELLENAVADDFIQWRTGRKNRFDQIKSRAKVYGVSVDDLAQAYPEEYRGGSYSRGVEETEKEKNKAKEKQSPKMDKDTMADILKKVNQGK